MEDLKRSNQKSFFSELKERYTSDSPANNLHEAAAKDQDYFQAQREECKKLAEDLQALKHQVATEPDRSNQSWNERIIDSN